MEGLTVMVVNGNRYLLSMDSEFSADKTADSILKQYPQDACVEFDNPQLKDFNNGYYPR